MEECCCLGRFLIPRFLQYLGGGREGRERERNAVKNAFKIIATNCEAKSGALCLTHADTRWTSRSPFTSNTVRYTEDTFYYGCEY